jgi:hypothetical protein
MIFPENSFALFGIMLHSADEKAARRRLSLEIQSAEPDQRE